MIKQYLTFGECKNINQELFLCADEQGYGIDIGEDRNFFDYFVVMDLCEIQKSENKKEITK